MSRAVIISLSALLLVGLVAAVTLGLVTNWGKSDDSQKLAASTKAVQAVCQPTDYKEACFKSLSKVKSDDPKELIKAAFESAKEEISHVVEKSPVLKELENDPKTADAVKDCKELFQDATDDLQRSFDEIGVFEWDKVDEMLAKIKVWLSATITYQETCLDGFENTTTDAGEKVRKILQTSMQMSSNGLAIVSDMSSLLGTLDMGSFNRRRLLSTFDDDRIVAARNRRLLNSADGPGNDDGDNTLLADNEDDRRRRRLLSSVDDNGAGEMFPIWLEASRRKLLEATNLTEDLKTKANVVVAKDGSGKYKTIEEALKEIPKNGNDTFIIYVKEGVYNEYLVLYKWMTHVVLVGDGPTKTRITNNKNFADGTKTFKTATLSVLGDFFMAKDIGVENTAGAIKHQAVALRVQSDQSIFYNCHMDGYQDTLYTHTYRQFYRDCRVTGTIDFIFGDAAAFFQNCTFVIRKPLENQHCIVTAQGRMERHQPTGIIIHKSKFEADPDYYPHKDKNKAYLGRPWKEYSKTIIMESDIGDFIQPEGWLPWEGNFGLDTCYYGEYNNVGAGSALTNRVKWRGIKTISHVRAEKFMPPQLYETDVWIKESGIPYDPTLAAQGPGGAALTDEDEDPNAPAAAPSSNSASSLKPSKTTGSSSSSSSSASESSTQSSSGTATGKAARAEGTSGSSSSSDAKGTEGSSGSSSSSDGQGTEGGSSSSSSSDGQGTNGGSGSSSSSDGQGTNGGSDSSSSSDTQGSEGSSSSSSSSDAQSTEGTSDSSSSSGAQSTEGSSGSSSSSNAQDATGSSDSSSSSDAQSTGGSSASSSNSNTEQLAGGADAPAPAIHVPTPAPAPIAKDAQAAGGSSSSSASSGAPAPAAKENQGAEGNASSASLEDNSESSDALAAGNEQETVLGSESSDGSSSSLSVGVKMSSGPVTIRDLERMLMANEEMGEDESNEDMSGNVPDGDEPSPAMASPSPAPSPSLISSIIDGPSLAPLSESDLSPALSPDEVSDWLPPAGAPGPDAETVAADEVPASPPPKGAGSKSKYEFHVILSGLAMWVVLAM